MRILVGSRAARYWWLDWRETKDEDWLLATPVPPDDKTDSHYEPEFAEHQLLLLGPHVCITSQDSFVATPDFLYTLKVSHSFWDIKWQKTITDIVFMKRRGCRLVPELYDVFYKVWTRVHGAKKANLNVSNESFFTENVKRVIPHDELHEIFKHDALPKYKQLKHDQSKALIARDLFDAQPYEEKLRTVREEMWVLASERFLLPGVTRSPAHACHLALKLLITSASRGWFPLFIVDNLESVMHGRQHTRLMEMVK